MLSFLPSSLLLPLFSCSKPSIPFLPPSLPISPSPLHLLSLTYLLTYLFCLITSLPKSISFLSSPLSPSFLPFLTLPLFPLPLTSAYLPLHSLPSIFLGNLTRNRECTQSMILLRSDEALLLLLAHNNPEIVSAVCGALVNLSGDPGWRFSYRTMKGTCAQGLSLFLILFSFGKIFCNCPCVRIKLD